MRLTFTPINSSVVRRFWSLLSINLHYTKYPPELFFTWSYLTHTVYFHFVQYRSFRRYLRMEGNVLAILLKNCDMGPPGKKLAAVTP